MTVIIYKNNEIQKSFKKFFFCFVAAEMDAWAKEKFPKAKRFYVDMGVNQIRIYY